MPRRASGEDGWSRGPMTKAVWRTPSGATRSSESQLSSLRFRRPCIEYHLPRSIRLFFPDCQVISATADRLAVRADRVARIRAQRVAKVAADQHVRAERLPHERRAAFREVRRPRFGDRVPPTKLPP